MGIVLGIDTSCDDTGIGIVKDGEVLANLVASQTLLHAPYGGVIPEKASREHLTVIDSLLEQTLKKANITLNDLTAVSATYGPGLVGALLVGLNYAKALAWAKDLPFIAIHHLEGHIASCMLEKDVSPPFLCLIASGGHTSLFKVEAWGNYYELGKTLDDAAGEAFDKVARLLELGYPGGPPLSKLAEEGNPKTFPFTIPLKQQQGFDFSFSGLKTAVATLVREQPKANKADIAASFEHTVVESLTRVSLKAAKKTGYETLIIAGGVAANRQLRERFARADLKVFFPPLELATDNGAMIALAAYEHLKTGTVTKNPWITDAAPYLPLSKEATSS